MLYNTSVIKGECSSAKRSLFVTESCVCGGGREREREEMAVRFQTIKKRKTTKNSSDGL